MKTKRVVLPVIAVIAAATLAAVAGWLVLDNEAAAQADLPAPANVQVADGDDLGQVTVSWDAVAGAAGYSVRWVNVDAALVVHDAGGDWEQYIQSIDIEGSDTTSHTLTVNRPRSGAQYAFAVGSRIGPDADPIWSGWEMLALKDAEPVLTAALAITRHASRLVDLGSIPTQGGMTDAQIARIGVGVNAQKAGVDQQMGALAGQGSVGRVRYINGLVNRLKSNADEIQEGRTELRNKLRDDAASRKALTTRNAGRLFPLANTSVDQQFYHVMTNFPEVGDVGMENISRDEVLDYVHLNGLASNAALGHTLLLIANLMQDPTFVARIQESYDSVAGRLDKDIEYLRANEVTYKNPGAIGLAEQMLNESRGDDSYFIDLEDRLELIRTENNLRDQNAEILPQLLEQLDALAKEAQGLDAPAVPAIRPAEVRDPGITDTEIHFGQSAALMGGNSALGMGMQDGIMASFEEANRNGGVHGRQLRLTSENDSYEPDLAFERTLEMIEGDDPVFALIGAVGTPTSRAALPLASSRGVPFVGPFTGAQFLREDDLTNVLNVRASYHEETKLMVDRLIDAGYTKVAVLYQNDSYGIDGLGGVEKALATHSRKPVASWYYTRNSVAVESAAFRIAEEQPEAVIVIGTSAPAAEIIKKLSMKLGEDTIFLNVSFVGSNALASALGDAGEGVYVTQVVPLPSDEDNQLVADYRAALSAVEPDAEPGFISLEGYLAGRLAIERLEACGTDVSRECFLNVFSESTTIDIADGLQLQYGPGDNQGSNDVFLTRINSAGEYELADSIQR